MRSTVFLSSPAVVGRTLYVGSGDHNVYALDAATGTKKWQFATGDVAHASPAVADGAVYIGSWDRFMYKLDARSGALRWKFATDDRKGPGLIGIPSSAAVADGTVYFGSRDGYFTRSVPLAVDCVGSTTTTKVGLLHRRHSRDPMYASRRPIY